MNCARHAVAKIPHDACRESQGVQSQNNLDRHIQGRHVDRTNMIWITQDAFSADSDDVARWRLVSLFLVGTFCGLPLGTFITDVNSAVDWKLIVGTFSVGFSSGIMVLPSKGTVTRPSGLKPNFSITSQTFSVQERW